MRIVLIILIGLHGFIHLFGFLKAFGISEFNAISQPISKASGVVWLLTFILFLVTIGLLIAQSKYWWIIGIVGVILSQFLIISFWSDAKFGSILNLIILSAAFIAYSTLSFKNKVSNEISTMLDNSKAKNEKLPSEEMLSGLPKIVQTWLLNSGAIGRDPVQNVYLEQEAQMLLKPDQKDWTNARAKQYFTIDPPGFNWSVSLKMYAFLNVVGRDKFENGKGEMTIKLFSLIPVVNAENNEKVNQATLQRYLAEIVWFPSAALSPYITWEAIDEHSARATMEFNGTKGSGTFHFKSDGAFEKFVTMRFKDANDFEPAEWTVTATKTEEINGIKIPVEAEADWQLDNGKWTWLKLKITKIEYNVD